MTVFRARPRRSNISNRITLALVATLFFGSRHAAADLTEDAERLEREWSQRGARAQRLSAVFAEHGQSRIIELAASPEHDAKPGCITAAFLGAPTIDFAVAPLRENAMLEMLPLPAGHPDVALDADSVRSVQGMVTLTRCNDERKQLARLVVSMRSQRGAIDTVVARSAATMGDALDVLPERMTGTIAPRGNPGRPIEPGPIAQRVVRAEEQARNDGAQLFSRLSTNASADGTGQTRLRLAEGCHRLSVMAAVPSSFPHLATDVDAEARDEEGRVLARDRAETPDARLDFCLGETSRVTVMYAGAAGPMPITIVDAVWPVATNIPNHWGARVRGGFARAFRRRNTPAPTAAPSVETLGSSGITIIPADVEQGRCYFAAVAVFRGEARSMRVSAAVGDRYLRDDVFEMPEGVGLTFCSEAEKSIRFDVDVRGNNVFWVFGLFPLTGGNP